MKPDHFYNLEYSNLASLIEVHWPNASKWNHQEVVGSILITGKLQGILG